MNPRQRRFCSVVKEAYGLAWPTTLSMFVADHISAVVYDVWLPDWGVQWQVVMPNVAICAHILLLQDLEADQVNDTHVRTYKVREVDAIAYALHTYPSQPAKVRSHLTSRFGPLLEEMRVLASERWGSTDLVF